MLQFFYSFQLCISIFLALLALGISLWQLFVNRQHNKKSVTPHLNIDDFLSPETNNGNIGLYLTNTGLGPAVIKEFNMYVEKEKYEITNRESIFNITKLLKLDDENCTYGGLYLGDWIASKDRFVIFEIKTNMENEKNYYYKLMDTLSKLSIQISYENIYGNKFLEKRGVLFDKPFGLKFATSYK